MLDAIEWKRAHPADDLLTALIAAEDDGERLTADELVDQVMLLYIAGHETTVNLIGNGTLALLAQPRAARTVAATTRRSTTNAVDELLRYDAPVQFSRRVTTADVDVGGQHHRARARSCSSCSASANRDPAQLGRRRRQRSTSPAPGAAQHLSFGSGIHHCLGAALARLEGRIALGTLVRRFPGLELAADDPGVERPPRARGASTACP